MVTPVFGSAGSMLSKGIDLDEVFSGESSPLVARQCLRVLCYIDRDFVAFKPEIISHF